MIPPMAPPDPRAKPSCLPVLAVVTGLLGGAPVAAMGVWGVQSSLHKIGTKPFVADMAFWLLLAVGPLLVVAGSPRTLSSRGAGLLLGGVVVTGLMTFFPAVLVAAGGGSGLEAFGILLGWLFCAVSFVASLVLLIRARGARPAPVGAPYPRG